LHHQYWCYLSLQEGFFTCAAGQCCYGQEGFSYPNCLVIIFFGISSLTMNGTALAFYVVLQIALTALWAIQPGFAVTVFGYSRFVVAPQRHCFSAHYRISYMLEV
jgi:hypothetical protein